MASRDATEELTAIVREACAKRQALRIVGGDTKSFFGRRVRGEPLSTTSHRGIVNYDRAELVITARAGTPIAEIEQALEQAGQRLPFEPPQFGPGATVGGTIAAGLAGPARVSAGPIRDYVLGCRVLTGDGRVLRFGGEVMKNVAGYDVSRLMVGALGILGVLLEVSLKVLPRPAASRTLSYEYDLGLALERLREWSATAGAPVASCWAAGRLHARFEGAPQTLDGIARRRGGETMYESMAFWKSVRDQTHASFRGARRLWRLQVPAVGIVRAPVATLVEWHGAQRWYADDVPVDWHRVAAETGGHATLFRGARSDEEVFAPLQAPHLRLHLALKQQFDPAGILNPGRMYEQL